MTNKNNEPPAKKDYTSFNYQGWGHLEKSLTAGVVALNTLGSYFAPDYFSYTNLSPITLGIAGYLYLHIRMRREIERVIQGWEKEN